MDPALDPASAELGRPEADIESSVGDTARPLAGSFAATGVIQLVQAVIAVLLARSLGPTGRGELAAVILWPTLLSTIGCLGIYPAATYFAARTSHLGVLVGSTLAFLFVDALILVGIGLAILPLVLSSHDPHVVYDGQIFLVFYIPLTLLAVTMMSILNGLHRFGWFQALRLLIYVMTLILLITFALFDRVSIGTATVAYAVGYGLTAVLGAAVVFRASWGTIAVEFAYIRKLLAFGLKSQLSVGMWNLNERGDQLVISAFFAPASLGLYVVAVTMTSLTTVIGFSAALVALPLVARISDRGERRSTVQALVGATLVCAILATIPIFLLEPYLIELLFGEDFSGATTVGRVLLIAAIFFGLNRMLEATLQAVDRPLESSIGESIALVVTALGLVVLLPALGILGAGITSLLAYASSACFLVRRVTRALEISPAGLLPTRRTFSLLFSTLKRR